MKVAECFYCIRVFRNPDETRSSSLWNGFSKGSNKLAINTKAKQRSCVYLVFAFSCFIKLLKHEQICKSVLRKMFLCDFCNCGCLIKDSLWSDLLCRDFEKWKKLLCRDKSCQFRSPKKPKRSFFARTFEVQKYRTKRSGLLMFSEIGKLHVKKNHTLYSSRRACSKYAKAWRKGSRTYIASP